MRKPRKAPIKMVKSEKVEPTPKDWTLPTSHWLKLDEARLAHWWAKLNGGDTVATLAAWTKLLHVPRTRKST
jgi:hypothetical protein